MPWTGDDDTEELPSELGATASPERVSDDLRIQDTLVSLLAVVKTLTAGLEEVKADNRQLRSLVEGKQDGLSAVASPPPRSDGADVSSKTSQPARVVTLPELRAVANLSQKADRRVAKLGLADSSESGSDYDQETSEEHDRVPK